MAILDVTGELAFDVYAFSFASLFEEFSVVEFDAFSNTLMLSSPNTPASFLVINGITNFVSLNEAWDGDVTAITYNRADVGQFSLTDFTLIAESFRGLALNNPRALFATIFQNNDNVSFGTGIAKIELGAGDDIVVGSTKDDFIVSGSGTDTITGNGGFDTLDYSNHTDVTVGITVTMTGNGSGTTLDPDGDLDSFNTIERVTGTVWSDIFNGTNMAGASIEWVGGNGADHFNGGTGFETINFDADKYTTTQVFSTGIALNLTTGIATDGFGSIDHFNNIDAIVATDQADTVLGGAIAFAATLRGGDDSFSGGAGNEWISAGAGNDSVMGGAGYDTVSYQQNDTPPENFNPSASFIIGGIVVFGGTSSSAAIAHDQYGGTDTLRQIEHIIGSQSNDVFIVGSIAMSFTGGKGSDTFNANAATTAIVDYSAEILDGGTMGVSINLLTSIVIDSFGDTDRTFGLTHFRGTLLADMFVGSSTLATSFFAGGGDDIINCGGGNDFIAPNAGNNHVNGGAGYDQLNYDDLALTNGIGLFVQATGAGTGEVTKASAEIDGFNEVEFIFGTRGDDAFQYGSFGGDFSGGDGSDTFTGGTSAANLDIVDYNAEKHHGGWQNGIIVNLSNGAFAATNTTIIAANSARDSYGKTDSLLDIDIVRGTSLNDVFVAGQKSVFEGGLGNDTYWLDGNDSAIEKSNAGIDSIYAKVSMSLPAYVENLTLLSSAQWAVGNSGNNNIVGNSLNNFISGHLGKDVFSGKSGRDTFRFDTKLSSSNRDTITDFSSTYDQLSLDKSYFSKIGNVGKLESKAFWIGTSAHDSSDRIIYNKATGAIYYDPDGAGSAAKIHFATLSNKATLSYADFDIVA